MNIVRMRYGDAPMFLDVASVINSYTLGGSVSGGASFQGRKRCRRGCKIADGVTYPAEILFSL